MEPAKENENTVEAQKNENKSRECLKKINIREKLVQLKKIITIEPMICLLVTAKMICGPALLNLHFEKACKVNAGFNDTVCDAIVKGTYRQMNFTEENNVVQTFLTRMRSWEVPVSSVVPVILILFLGAYSDRHRIRKPFLLMPLVGDMVGLVGTAVNVVYMRQWSLEIQIIAERVIPSLFGSDKLLMAIGFAYIADISSPDMRTIRLTTIPIILTIITPLLQAVSGIMFRELGYMPILGISTTFFLLALLFGVIMIKEPVKVEKDTKYLIRDIFNISHVTDTFKILMPKKEHPNRTNFILLLFVGFLHSIVGSGEMSTFFLFAQQAYQWTVVEYSYFLTTGTVAKFLGLSIAVPIFVKVFKLTDIMIIIIAYFDAVFVSCIFIIVQSPLGLYIGRACSVLIAAGNAAHRSLLTKVVSSEDIAKASSLHTILTALAAALAAQIYHQGIYEHTRRTFPQAFLLFGVGTITVEIVILFWMYWREKRNHQISEKPAPETMIDAQIIDEVQL